MRGWLEDGLVPQDVREQARTDVAQCNATLNSSGCSSLALNPRMSTNPTQSQGGELFTLGRAELRFPVAGVLEGALFFDTGNLWLDPRAFQWLKLRYATGIGLRLMTPIGPAALDVAINLDPNPALNESRIVPQFSIGMF